MAVYYGSTHKIYLKTYTLFTIIANKRLYINGLKFWFAPHVKTLLISRKRGLFQLSYYAREFIKTHKLIYFSHASTRIIQRLVYV